MDRRDTAAAAATENVARKSSERALASMGQRISAVAARRRDESDAAAMLAGLSAALGAVSSLREYETRLRVMVAEAESPTLSAFIRDARRHIEGLERRIAPSAVGAREAGTALPGGAPLAAAAADGLAAGGLAALTLSTIRNRVTAVLSALRHAPPEVRERFKESREEWAAFHARLRQAEEDEYMQSGPRNERQRSEYVSLAEVELKVAELLKGPADPHTTRGESQQTLLLAFYAHVVPKRSELGTIRVFEMPPQGPGGADRGAKGSPQRVAAPPPPSDEELQKINYLVLHGPLAADMVINLHKTQKKHGPLVEHLPPAFVAVLRASLARHPRAFVFEGRSGTAMSNNACTQFVANAFKKHFGRSAGTSLLRHAFVSERIDFNTMSLAERQGLASRMGHSLGTQEKVYHWVKGKVPVPTA